MIWNITRRTKFCGVSMQEIPSSARKIGIALCSRKSLIMIPNLNTLKLFNSRS